MTSDPKMPICWRREPSRQAYLDYVSDDGRWTILHPRNATSNRWELYDGNAVKPWSGDFRSLNEAKARAALTQRLNR